jgi:hypothetical protein
MTAQDPEQEAIEFENCLIEKMRSHERLTRRYGDRGEDSLSYWHNGQAEALKWVIVRLRQRGDVNA